jgi:carbon-monoxide dehydrogenase medium subunit
VKPPPFEYADPGDVAEAVALLADLGDEAKVLAGGQSLVPLLNFRLARPRYLVDINRVPDLDYILPLDGGLALGALVRQRAVERSDLVRERCPLLHEAIQQVGHVQIRNRGTLGGNLAHADPSSELPAVITALDGRLRVRGPAGERVLSAGDFYLGYLTTALGPDELLVAAELPAWPLEAGSCFLEFSRRAGDFALVGVAAILALDGDGRVQRAGLALTGVGGRPFDAAAIATEVLGGERPDEAAVRAVAERVGAAVEPDSDIHAPAEYRKHLAEVLTRRALLAAAERARTEQGEQ